MTDEQLVMKAVEKLRAKEALLTNFPERLRTVRIDSLPLRHIRDAVIIYFEGEANAGQIRAYLDRETGDMIEAQYSPPK